VAKKAKTTTPAAAAVDPNASNTVFVGNMSWGTDEESLRAAFDGIGEITSVRVGKAGLISVNRSPSLPCALNSLCLLSHLIRSEAWTCVLRNTGMDRETGRSRGFAHVEFSTPAEAASAAAKFNGQEIDGRVVKVEVAAPRGTPGGNRSAGETLSVFVKGFDASLGEDAVRSALQELFADCGEITRLSLPTDRRVRRDEVRGESA